MKNAVKAASRCSDVYAASAPASPRPSAPCVLPLYPEYRLVRSAIASSILSGAAHLRPTPGQSSRCDGRATAASLRFLRSRISRRPPCCTASAKLERFGKFADFMASSKPFDDDTPSSRPVCKFAMRSSRLPNVTHTTSSSCTFLSSIAENSVLSSSIQPMGTGASGIISPINGALATSSASRKNDAVRARHERFHPVFDCFQEQPHCTLL